jgi:PAS domain S-box-containing protein
MYMMPDSESCSSSTKKITDVLGYEFNDIQGWDDFVFKDDAHLVQEELNKLTSLNDNDTHHYNCRLNHKEGNWRYFRTQGTILSRDENGSPASLLFIAHDITQQMQTDNEAKASKDLLNETEELLHFGTWTWDTVNNQVQWSKGLYTILGYSENELSLPVTNDSFLSHVARTDATDLQSTIQNALTQKTSFKKTFTVITKDREERIVSTLGKVVTSSDGNVLKIIGVMTDVTEQVQLNKEQQHLKDNLAKYRESMIERERLLHFGSLEMDLLTRDLHWSDGMYLLFGYDPVNDKGSITINDDFYKLHMSEADLSSSKSKLIDALKNKDNYVIETSIRTTDGTVKKLETYGKIERQVTGEPYKVLGITRDITRLKDYEKNLQLKIEELDRSNKELEEFSYIASHDLQEPLRKITAFSERLQERAGHEISQEAQLYLQRIIAATHNMRSLIDNLLEFSRTSRTNQPFETVDLNVVLKLVTTDLELKIEETNTVIESSSLPVITAIPSQMIQLFTNIIANAIKFKKPAEAPLLKVSSEPLTDKEKASRFLVPEKLYYKIVISDAGIGFEQEYAAKIFQIFQRLHGKAEYPGSGIGLAICKKIVDNHNGIIYAESAPGRGSTFSFIFPEKQ